MQSARLVAAVAELGSLGRLTVLARMPRLFEKHISWVSLATVVIAAILAWWLNVRPRGPWFEGYCGFPFVWQRWSDIRPRWQSESALAGDIGVALLIIVSLGVIAELLVRRIRSRKRAQHNET